MTLRFLRSRCLHLKGRREITAQETDCHNRKVGDTVRGILFWRVTQ